MPPGEESSTTTGPLLHPLDWQREVDRKTWVSVLWRMRCLGIGSDSLRSFLPWNFMSGQGWRAARPRAFQCFMFGGSPSFPDAWLIETIHLTQHPTSRIAPQGSYAPIGFRRLPIGGMVIFTLTTPWAGCLLRPVPAAQGVYEKYPTGWGVCCVQYRLLWRDRWPPEVSACRTEYLEGASPLGCLTATRDWLATRCWQFAGIDPEVLGYGRTPNWLSPGKSLVLSPQGIGISRETVPRGAIC